MKNFDKIKLYKDIKNITKNGEKFVLNFAIIYKVANLEKNAKLNLGILISKKFGNAVKRNKAKRRIIAAINASELRIKESFVFIPRNYILKVDFQDIVLQLNNLLVK